LRLIVGPVFCGPTAQEGQQVVGAVQGRLQPAVQLVGGVGVDLGGQPVGRRLVDPVATPGPPRVRADLLVVVLLVVVTVGVAA